MTVVLDLVLNLNEPVEKDQLQWIVGKFDSSAQIFIKIYQWTINFSRAQILLENTLFEIHNFG